MELINDIKMNLLRRWALHSGIFMVCWIWWPGRFGDRRGRYMALIGPGNRVIGKFVAQNGGVVVWLRQLEKVDEKLLRADGVHLNAIGHVLYKLGGTKTPSIPTV